jgi:hypothetical protein
LQKKYEDYIESVDTLRDTVGKLKVQSIKMREGIGKWKLQQRSSTNLLNEFVTNISSTIPDDDDCVNASSSAPDQDYQENFSDSDDDWVSIVEPPSPDRKCRFVNHERKKPIKPHFPSCPIQNPKNILTQRKPFTRIDTPMETPIINENSILREN